MLYALPHLFIQNSLNQVRCRRRLTLFTLFTLFTFFTFFTFFTLFHC